jgi:hypothetical protein
LNGKNSRDIDVIVDVSSARLLEIIESSNCSFTTNRHGGIKVVFDKIHLDIWSIQDNWAFKNNLVTLNEEDKLKSIAKGCFYNFDSLVINLHNFSYNLQYYNDFKVSNTLEILQSRPIYKNLNPTVEANILRAFYIKYKFNSSYSLNTYQYLINTVGALNDDVKINSFQRLMETREKYPKYNELTDELIMQYLVNLKRYDNPSSQLLFDL